MQVAFFGTPPPSVKYLEALDASEHEVVVAITQPDRPAGRGRKLRKVPVREAAERLGLPVLAPASAADTEFLEELRGYEPELGVVVAYGQILRPKLLELPREGFVNVHYSLLPALRGAAPVYGALRRGLTTTGVTIQRMVEELDAGEIILQEEVEILYEDNRGTLTERLTNVGVGLLLRAIDQIERGEAQFVPQDDSASDYVGRVETDDCRIEWNLPPEELRNLVRACTPWPGAWCMLGDQRIKVQDTHVVQSVLNKEGTPGEIVEIASDRGPVVAAGAGAVEITRLQPAGKRSMSGAEFSRGARLHPGDRLN